MMIPCWGLMNWDYDYVLACACFFLESVWFDVFKTSEGCWVSVLWPSAHADYCAVFGEHDTSACLVRSGKPDCPQHGLRLTVFSSCVYYA